MHALYDASKADVENVPPKPTAVTIAPNLHAPQTTSTSDVASAKIEDARCVEIPPNQFYRS
jgi:hypothetical protein